jgi:SAM-dependent methyltransferase
MPDPISAANLGSAAPSAAPLRAFLQRVHGALEDASFSSLVLSKNRERASDLRAVRIRSIALRGVATLSFTHSRAASDVTRNFEVAAGLDALAALLDPAASPSFAHATLHRAGGDTQLRVSKKGRCTLRLLPAAPEAVGRPAAAGAALSALAEHDRQRERRLPLELRFLRELGITDERHRLVPSMARKWRQIDKFLEVLDHALDALPAALRSADGGTMPIRVVDFGCGKGYLTFAVHEHLRRRFGIAPQVTGVELRADLVALCNAVAERTQAVGLNFVEGDLRSHEPAGVDVMIALHACDTATDHAIALGVRAGAAILVCSPCCHKELRPQMTRPRLLSGLLRHGIHLGQEAEMVTDSLRALLLETCGYDAQVFEFVALEHTRKNKMILARRCEEGEARAGRARAEVNDLKSFYGIREQCLETLLRDAAGGASVQARPMP